MASRSAGTRSLAAPGAITRKTAWTLAASQAYMPGAPSGASTGASLLRRKLSWRFHQPWHVTSYRIAAGSSHCHPLCLTKSRLCTGSWLVPGTPSWCQASGKVQPGPGAGHWEDVLHKPGDTRKYHQPPIGEQIGDAPEVSQHFLTQTGCCQHQGGGLHACQQRPQVTPWGPPLELADHVSRGRRHLCGIPPNIRWRGQLWVQAPCDRTFHPGGNALALDHL